MGKRGAVAIRGKRTEGKSVKLSNSALLPTHRMTKGGKEAWEQLVSSFPVGHFTESDRLLLEQFCEAAAQHRNATATLHKEGRKYRDARGVWRRHPAVDDQHQARCDCAMLATKLRITKQSMISPKGAGRAATDAADAAAIQKEPGFGDLLFSGDEVMQ